MRIKWHGQSLFEVKVKNLQKDLVKVVIDPFDKSLGLKVPRLPADILLVTHSHHDHSNISAVKGSPFLIDGPGEYEVQGVMIKGIPAFHDEAQGEKRGKVTMYTIEAEEVRVAHLSDLGQPDLTEKQLDDLGEVNVLMVPVGGVYTIDAGGAQKVINQIEPQIVIPMHYKIPNLDLDLHSVKKFLKKMGVKSTSPKKKLYVKQKDLTDEMKVEVLKPFSQK